MMHHDRERLPSPSGVRFVRTTVRPRCCSRARISTDKLAERLGLDPSRIHAIFPELGNVGPASIPLVLTQAAELGRLSKG